MTYGPKEEKLNILTHAMGIPLAVVALVLMLLKSSASHEVLSSFFFGVSLLMLYSASTLYHSAKAPAQRQKLRIFDHAAIYILIAGTYTPLCLIVLQGQTGNILFGIIWSIAVLGVMLKLFFTGRFKVLSTTLYVLMGWVAVFVYQPLSESISPEGIQWILGGGVSYTVGAIFYSMKKVSYSHAIFHCFVLAGSFCHFIAVYFFIL